MFEESEKRNRKAPERYSDTQWVRVIGVHNMTAESGVMKDGAVKALLDLHYQGRDAIIRAVTPAAYPALRRFSGKTGADKPVDTPHSALWEHVLAIDEWSRQPANRMARFPRRAHVTSGLKQSISLAAQCIRSRFYKPTVTSRSFTLSQRERLLTEIIRRKVVKLRNKKEEFLFGLGLSRSDKVINARRQKLDFTRKTGVSVNPGEAPVMEDFAKFRGIQAARKERRNEEDS